MPQVNYCYFSKIKALLSFDFLIHIGFWSALYEAYLHIFTYRKIKLIWRAVIWYGKPIINNNHTCIWKYIDQWLVNWFVLFQSQVHNKIASLNIIIYSFYLDAFIRDWWLNAYVQCHIMVSYVQFLITEFWYHISISS